MKYLTGYDHQMVNHRALLLVHLAILTFCVHSTSQQFNQTNATNSTLSPTLSTTVNLPTTKTSLTLERCAGGKDVWKVCWLSNPPYVYMENYDNKTNVQGILIEALTEGLKLCGCKTNIAFKMANNYDEFLNCSKSDDVDIVLPFPRKEADVPSLLFTVVDSPEIYLLLNRKTVETEAKKRVLSEFFSVWTIAVLTVLLAIIFGIIVWFLDFSWNNEQFPPSFLPGSLEGVWWSFVTLTTVGYGDKTPKFPVARILAVLWMFIGMGMISLLTATMTKALTTAVFDYQTYIQVKNMIGVLNRSYTYDEAVKKGMQPYEFTNLTEMYKTLDDPNNKKIAGIFVDIFVATFVKNNPTRYKMNNTLFVAKSYDVVYPLAFYLAPGVTKYIHLINNHFRNCFHTTFLRANKQINVYAIVDRYIQRASTSSQNKDKENEIKFEIDLFKSNEDTFIFGVIVLCVILVVLIALGLLWQIIQCRRSRSKSFIPKSKGADIETFRMASHGFRPDAKSLKAITERLDEVDKALDTLSAFREMVTQFKRESNRFDAGMVNGTTHAQGGPARSAVNMGFNNAT